MAPSPVDVILHIIFSTKYQSPKIVRNIESEVFSFSSAKCKLLNCRPYAVGGFADHVHIGCALDQEVSVEHLVTTIKVNSSKWIKSKFAIRDFYWQEGYGCFSVHQNKLDRLIEYIEQQDKHHTRKNFQDEYREFLKLNKVEFDERHMWD